MTSIAKIRQDVTKELKANLGTAKLDETGRIMFRHVFDITIGLFARRQARVKIDVWRSAKFRRFILIQAKMIGRDASKSAKGGTITSTIFNKSAVRVMKATNKGCRITVKGGKVRDIPNVGSIVQLQPVRLDGDVCSIYLQSQTF